MIVIANVFPKLRTVKTCVDQFIKSTVSEHPFATQHVQGSQALAKSLWEIFYNIF